MTDAARVTGLVLAGGRATRMGSVDKGLQSLDDRPLVAHVLDRLAPQVDAIVVSANRHRDAYAHFGHSVVTDTLGTDEGPLAGIHAGLSACAPGLLVVVPCDAPDFPRDLVRRLAEPFAAADVVATSAVTPQRAHPVFCMMRTTALPALVAFFDAGGRSVHRWLEAMHGRAVSFADEEAFRNLNTLDDLHEARARPR